MSHAERPNEVTPLLDQGHRVQPPRPISRHSLISEQHTSLTTPGRVSDNEEGQVGQNYGATTAGETSGSDVVVGGAVPPSGTSSESIYMNIEPIRFWFVFVTIMFSYFVGHFDLTLMASSHPFITSYFNASQEASWLTTAFMITNTGFQPLWGRLSDAIGRKTVYLIAVVIFAASSLWCGLVGSIGSLVAARAVCGIGVGGSMSMGLVITSDLVRIEHRGTYLSHINLASGVGSALGAALGGIICEAIGWRWAFGIQVPLLTVCALLAIFAIPNDLAPLGTSKQNPGSSSKSMASAAWTVLKSFDSLGLATIVLAVALLTMFLNIGGNELPWSHPLTILCGVLGLVLSFLALVIERKAKNPVMPLHFLANPPHMNLTYANFLAGFASNTVLFNAPLWFQGVQLDSPATSGLRLTIPAIGGSIAAIGTGNLITLTGRLKPLLLIGASVYLAGSAALLLLRRSMPAALQIAILTPTPLSQGFIYPASMMSALAVSPQADQGVVTTTLSLWRNLGIVLGVATSSLVFQNTLAVFLAANVRGPDAARAIRVARRNVGEIRNLDGPYRDQVIKSYASSLRLSFVAAIVASGVLLLLMIPLRLPRLKRGPSMRADVRE